MINIVLVQTLTAVKLKPVLVRKHAGVVASTIVRIAHKRNWSVLAEVFLVHEFDIFFHPFFVKDTLSNIKSMIKRRKIAL